MSVIIVIALNLLCMGHAVVHGSEAAESSTCGNDQQCGSDNMGLLQHKVQTDALEDNEQEDHEADEEGASWAFTGSPPTYNLAQSDFAGGTYRIKETQRGIYTLTEDIVFDPTPTYPPFDSSEYLHTDGYFLGFFAAIAVEADEVEIDCAGHKMEMSERFHKHQRFFALIEFGSRPFITGAGPPPFSRAELTQSEFRTPTKVRVKNCNFGMTSHYAIHGNDAKQAEIHDVHCTDFEVACISLNNCHDCNLHDIVADGNLQDTWPAELSQAILLNHMVNEIPWQDGTSLGNMFKDVPVNLRGDETTNKGVVLDANRIFKKLKLDLDDFLNNDPPTGDFVKTMGKGGLALSRADKIKPDGSAVYGVVMNMRGPAAGVFGAEPFEGKIGDLRQKGKLVPGAQLRRITVRNLKLKPEGWISFRIKTDPVGKKKLQDPAGAVFRASVHRDRGNADKYRGNALSDAQIALGHVVKYAANSDLGRAKTLAAQYYGGTILPDPLLQWANHEITWDAFKANYDVRCHGDAMDHFNKGIVGIRLEYLDGPTCEDFTVNDLTNLGEGEEDKTLCDYRAYKTYVAPEPEPQAPPPQQYFGNDVKALLLVNVANQGFFDTVLTNDPSTLTAGKRGSVVPKRKMRTRKDIAP